MRVKELIEKLKELDPELEARIWDENWGDHIPIDKVCVFGGYLTLECDVKAFEREGYND